MFNLRPTSKRERRRNRQTWYTFFPTNYFKISLFFFQTSPVVYVYTLDYLFPDDETFEAHRCDRVSRPVWPRLLVTPSFVQTMACLLFGIKQLGLPEPMMTYHRFDPYWQTSLKFELKYKNNVHLKMLFAKSRPYCFTLSVLTPTQIQCDAVITRSIFKKDIHKRHSIARPLGLGMGCLLWVQNVIDILHLFL